MKKLLFCSFLLAGLSISARPSAAVIPYDPTPRPTPVLTPHDVCLMDARTALGKCTAAVRKKTELTDLEKAEEDLICYHEFYATLVDCYCKPPVNAAWCWSDCATAHTLCRVDADFIYAQCNLHGMSYCAEKRERDRCVCDVVFNSCPRGPSQSRLDACEDLVPQPPLPREVDPDDDGEPGVAPDPGPRPGMDR